MAFDQSRCCADFGSLEWLERMQSESVSRAMVAIVNAMVYELAIGNLFSSVNISPHLSHIRLILWPDLVHPRDRLRQDETISEPPMTPILSFIPLRRKSVDHRIFGRFIDGKTFRNRSYAFPDAAFGGTHVWTHEMWSKRTRSPKHGRH